MIIELNPNWRINAIDESSWAVQRLYPATEKRREAAWVNQAYFGRLDGAVAYAARKQIMIAEGTYGAEALAPIIEMTDRVEREAKAAMQAYLDAQNGD